MMQTVLFVCALVLAGWQIYACGRVVLAYPDSLSLPDFWVEVLVIAGICLGMIGTAARWPDTLSIYIDGFVIVLIIYWMILDISHWKMLFITVKDWLQSKQQLRQYLNNEDSIMAHNILVVAGRDFLFRCLLLLVSSAAMFR